MLECLGFLTLLIWLYLFFARGQFWRIREETSVAFESESRPRVAIVIPARDEAETIQTCVASCAAQDYAGVFHIFLVDDHSSDGTGELARAVLRQSDREHMITVVDAKPLPSGWTGKLWAVHCGLEQARYFEPDFVLFTDADIVHSSQTLSDLVARAGSEGYDLVSYMVKLRCSSFAEKALIPAFVYFFFKLYPPRWIEDVRSTTAGAAGGCILIRRSILDRIGGIGSIRGELIDDCALARAVKRTSGKIWLGVTSSSQSIREYNTFREIRRMVSRTAFTQLHYSGLLLAGTVIAMILTYILPPALLLFGGSTVARMLGGGAYALMMLSYLPMLRFYGRSPLWALSLPLVAVVYSWASIDSAVRYWRGAGGEWKGRFQQ
jgi:hopene-associated glycosyltransferase HpnB